MPHRGDRVHRFSWIRDNADTCVLRRLFDVREWGSGGGPRRRIRRPSPTAATLASMTVQHAFAAELWVWDAATKGSWFFLTVPEDVSVDLRFEGGEPRGFGSVRVEATIGGSVWKTSVFPSSDQPGCYVLPVKKAVRDAEQIGEGDHVNASVRASES
jgi:Domain of unknown function (DUF1905)